MKPRIVKSLPIVAGLLILGLVVWVGLLVAQSFLKYNPTAARKVGAGVPVKVASAAMEELPEVIGATSLAEPTLSIDVKSQVAGKIKAVPAEIGQMVSKGAKLVELDPMLFIVAAKSAEDELAKAKTDVENNKLSWERNSYLYSHGVVAKVTLEAAALTLDTSQSNYTKAQEALVVARKNLEHVNVLAPDDGVIMKRPTSDRIASPGETVAIGDVLLSLGVMRFIMVAAQVPQEKVDSVYVGQTAEVVFDSYPSLILSGQVQKIDPQTDPLNRTFKAYIKVAAKLVPTGKAPAQKKMPAGQRAGQFDAASGEKAPGTQPPAQGASRSSSNSKIPELKLTPGLSAYARLQYKRTMLMIPRLAVVKNAGESTVFVVENSRAHLRRVRTGVELSRNVEVLSGLKPGDQVVYYGLLGLKDNDSVNLQAFENSDRGQEPNGKDK